MYKSMNANPKRMHSAAANRSHRETHRHLADIRLSIKTTTDITRVLNRGRSFARLHGMSPEEAALVATALSALACEILQHVRSGEIIMVATEDCGRRGITVTARERGRACAHDPASLQRRLLDVGAAGTRIDELRRLMDEFELVAEVGKDTAVTIRKWTGAAPRPEPPHSPSASTETGPLNGAPP